jgi:phosphopantothenoylcysteine decarboxylase/phosphopantothenate--cysteine ligase
MDLDMFQHPSTQKNITTLRSYGNRIIEPQTGELASGLSGPGRLEEPERILEIIHSFFLLSSELKGKKVLVTAGPTFEQIDPVRFIGNRSSGRMGFALAEEAAGRGAEVTLITGPVAIDAVHPAIRRIDVESAAAMYKACRKHAGRSDIILMSAAVADYTPATPVNSKIRKQASTLNIRMEPTTDILLELGKKKKKSQLLVGFALETGNEEANALKKLRSKKLDMIVLNSLRDAGAGFNYPTNKVTLFLRNGKVLKGDLKEKREVACDIFNALTLLDKTRTR